ncbi:electron transport complex subunit RsxC [Agarivorans sp. MS3-6]
MVAWIEKIKQGFTWGYQGGVHPETNKQNINCDIPERIADPEILSIPVQQHIGSAGKLLVSIGEKVLRGQALTQSQFFQAPPVHASCAGEVIAIEPRVSAHASAIPELSVVIKVDSEQQDAQWPAPLTEEQQTPELICQRVHQSGISGMGGAGFPTALKITPHKPLDVLIINGAECEPYISADDCLMQNYAEEIIKGVRLLQKVLKPQLTIIAVEDDKPAAIHALEANTDESIVIRSIPTKYPSGGEKQLIQVLTGKEVAAQQLPLDLGMLVQNVGTAYAIHRAVALGEPLISRIVTLAGDLVTSPSNYWVPIGTSVADVIANKLQAASTTPTIMGGSMMGFMLPSNSAPVVKTTNCLIVNDPQAAAKESPCIRCGECAQACPMGLLPQQLYWFAQGNDLSKARDFNMMDCIECGACAFVCPSQISLVQHYRTAKAKIKAEDVAQQEADIAKQRFDARQARLEKAKQERKAKHQQAALRRQSQTTSDTSSSKPDPVAAALARVKQKGTEAPNAIQTETGEWIPDNQDAIAQREARKAKRRAEKQNNAGSSNPAVAAAIARAKAKKSINQTDADSTTEDANSQSSNPAVAAAIARAKAKKAAGKPVAEEAKEETSAKATNPAVDAAIARAKAKKLDAKHLSEPAEANQQAEKKVNPAVAAAVARAKAKKLAETTETADVSQQSEKKVNPAVAAAVARAKAKKLAETAETADVSQQAEKKVNPAVAAAVARAKAKKLANQQNEEKLNDE